VIADSTGRWSKLRIRQESGGLVVLSSFFRRTRSPRRGASAAHGGRYGSVIKDKNAGEQLLRQSDLDWTIIYASLLKDGPVQRICGGTSRGGDAADFRQISRADVAEWMVQAATQQSLSRRKRRDHRRTRNKENVALEAVRK